MVDEQEFQRWLSQAVHTLDSAARDCAAKDYAWACFKAEQAGQFALKAFLRGLGQPAFGHSTSALLETIRKLGITVLDEVEEAARELERHYIPARYPDAYPSGGPADFYRHGDAERALAAAKTVINFVQKEWERAQGP